MIIHTTPRRAITAPIVKEVEKHKEKVEKKKNIKEEIKLPLNEGQK